MGWVRKLSNGKIDIEGPLRLIEEAVGCRKTVRYAMYVVGRLQATGLQRCDGCKGL